MKRLACSQFVQSLQTRSASPRAYFHCNVLALKKKDTIANIQDAMQEMQKEIEENKKKQQESKIVNNFQIEQQEKSFKPVSLKEKIISNKREEALYTSEKISKLFDTQGPTMYDEWTEEENKEDDFTRILKGTLPIEEESDPNDTVDLEDFYREHVKLLEENGNKSKEEENMAKKLQEVYNSKLNSESFEKTPVAAATQERITVKLNQEQMHKTREIVQEWERKGYHVHVQHGHNTYLLLHKKREEKNQPREQQASSSEKQAELALMEQSIFETLENHPEEARRMLKELGMVNTKPYEQYLKNTSLSPKQSSANDNVDEQHSDDEQHGDQYNNELEYFTLEQQKLLNNENESKQTLNKYKHQVEEYEDDFDRYKQFASTSQRLHWLQFQYAQCNSSLLKMPRELSERIANLLRSYPKHTIKRAAKILSAVFRLRTGGFGHEHRWQSSTGTTNATGQTNTLFEEQKMLLQQLGKLSPPTSQQKTKRYQSSKQDNNTQQPQIIYGEYEAVAYAAHRLPSVYATSYRIMNEVNARFNRTLDWTPKTMLDFGTGPGTSIWAANEIWPSLQEITAVEPSSAMMDVALKLLPETVSQRITWRRFLNEHLKRTFHIVNASFVLNEISSSAERIRLIKTLWRVTDDILILVEPGTPLGFGLIREARSILLKEQDAAMVAPCPHDMSCPMSDPFWCHFSQRIQREPFQRRVKEGITKPYEDEKYSFIVLRKKRTDSPLNAAVSRTSHVNVGNGSNGDDDRIQWEYRKNQHAIQRASWRWSRIVNRPILRGGHAYFDLCGPQGSIKRKSVLVRAQGQIYKYATRLFWGDLLPMEWLKKNH